MVRHKAVKAKAGSRLSLEGETVAVHYCLLDQNHVKGYQPFFSG